MTKTSTPDWAFELRGFELGYPTTGGVRMIMDSVDLAVPSGEFILFVGPSGAGKSSLIAALLGFEDPYEPRQTWQGELQLLGEKVTGTLSAKQRRRVGVAFQDGALIDELTPRENVALPVAESGLPKERTDELLRAVGLPQPPKVVAALSGGQRKRVALARALANDPQLLVLDEPTAGLDPAGAKEIATLIRQVHDEREERTTLIITHDLEAFLPKATRILYLDAARGALRLLTLEEFSSLTPSTKPVRAPLLPEGAGKRSLRQLERWLLSCASVGRLLPRLLRHVVPYHWRMLGRALVDQVIDPALYLAVSAATTGALATCFALRNNPLDGAFQKEILLGNGKVLVSTALPLIVAVLFAARTAASACAQIGSHRRSRVFEALPLMGVSPEAFMLTPLFWSSVVGCSIATALGVVSGSLASLAVTAWLTPFTPFAWAAAHFGAIDGTDFRYLLIKSCGTGAITALTAFHLAARAKNSARDVAVSTNQAIVWVTLWVLLLHGALTLTQFWS